MKAIIKRTNLSRKNIIQVDIENQLAFNRGKNFFHKEALLSLVFAPETLVAIKRFGEIDSDTKKILVDFITNRVLQEFCKVNQYYTFNTQSQKDLRDFYIELYANIRNPDANRDVTAKNHYTKLKNLLLKANSFSEKIYLSKDEVVEPVTCHEYSAELQLEILKMNMDPKPAPKSFISGN